MTELAERRGAVLDDPELSNKMREKGFVITSYSIHYTKLYEVVAGGLLVAASRRRKVKGIVP